MMTFSDVFNLMIAKNRQERSTESLVEQAVGLVRWLSHNFDDGGDSSNNNAVMLKMTRCTTR